MDNTVDNKKKIHKSKQQINLRLVNNLDQIVISNKFKYDNDGFKYFTGYKEDSIFKSLCITYFIWGDTKNTLKTVEKTCPL